jgi:sulfate adenylyltransferase subunit 2
MKAFHPAPPPFPLLHVDTTWKFREMIRFRDEHRAASSASSCSCTPIRTASRRASVRSRTARPVHTDIMKTQALKQALDKYGFDAAFGGARRDEEKSPGEGADLLVPQRGTTAWDPKAQRPELWRLYNARKRSPARAIRVFPMSNWTELDIWQYIHRREHPDRAACTSPPSARWWSGTAR